MAQMTGEKSYLPHLNIAGALIIATGLVQHFEGERLKAYWDPPHVATVCDGHTKGVKITDIETPEKCKEFLNADLTDADNKVDKLVKVKMTTQQRAAFDDFVFNVGAGTFAKSSILRDFNAGAVKQSCADLLKYVYAGHQKLKGLVERRQAEYALCMEGVK